MTRSFAGTFLRKALSCSLCTAIAVVSVCPGVSIARERSGKKVKWVKSKYGLKSLIELSKDMASMAKELDIEDENYYRVKDSIKDGYIEKGMDAVSVEKRCGQPVIYLEGDGGTTQWVYKPKTVSFFDDEKIYLVFDEGEILREWKLPEEGEQT